MNGLKIEVNLAVRAFVAQVADLARNTQFETFDSVGGDELAERITVCVATHPGLYLEQITSRLGLTSRELLGPLRKLVATGAIRAEGQRRWTMYYAVEPQLEAAVSVPPRTVDDPMSCEGDNPSWR